MTLSLFQIFVRPRTRHERTVCHTSTRRPENRKRDEYLNIKDTAQGKREKKSADRLPDQTNSEHLDEKPKK